MLKLCFECEGYFPSEAMAFCFAHLRDGHVGPRMQWVWRQLMVVITVMMIIGKCSGLEDCAVFTLFKGRSSPPKPVTETLTLGMQFSPSHLTDSIYIFAETDFLLTTDMMSLSISFDGTHFMCSKDGLPATKGSRGTSVTLSRRNDWLHIPISLRNGQLAIQSNEDICPQVPLTGGNTVFRIENIGFDSEVVFNCHEGCPIYTDFVLVKRFSLPAYVRKLKADASAMLDFSSLFQIHVWSPTKTTEWEQITVEYERNETGMLEYAALKVGMERVWKETSWQLIGLDIERVQLMAYNSKNIQWSINCDPRLYDSPGMTGITNTTCPSEQSSGITNTTGPSEECSENEVGCNLAITLPNVLLFLATLVMFIYILRNKKFIKRQQDSTQASLHFSRHQAEDRPIIHLMEGADYITPNQPAQELQPRTRNENSGNPPLAAQPSDV